MGVILSVVFLLLFVLYAGFETIKYFAGPSLVVESPKDLSTLRDPLVTVRGKVERAAYITINGKQIFADTEGNFESELLLPSGYTIIRVEVKDRFGKQIWKDLHLAHVPAATSTKKILDPLIEEATTTEETL